MCFNDASPTSQSHLSNNPPPLQGTAEETLGAVGVRRALGGARDALGGDEQVQKQREEGGDRRGA